MLIVLFKMKFYWHLFHQRYNEMLLKDCLDEKLKSKLSIKVLYHKSHVITTEHFLTN